MNEYKVKIEAQTGSIIFRETFKGIEIYEAKTAKEALEKAKSELIGMLVAEGIDVDEDNVRIIYDVEKI